MNDNIDYCHHDSKTLNTSYYQVLNGGRSSGKTFQTINMYQEKYDKLQSNWNSLRELIKWRPIQEYDENKYDWVLVKYYDGDYECVPTVAERRKGANKWYDTNNNEIIFEVKYFFDMQLLDKMNELEGKDKNEKV